MRCSLVRRQGIAAAGFVAAAAVLQPSADSLPEFAARLVRPAVLPFAWQGVEAARRRGDVAEEFARAQQLLALLPSWVDGHCAFAFRFALAPAPDRLDEPERGQRALARLELAMAWMEAVRPRAGRHELGLLQALAFLPDVAARNEPALAALLRLRGGPAALADPWLAAAERAFPTAAVREQRTFYAPTLAAGLLTAGDTAGALAVLRTAIERSHEVRNQELAAVWRQRLEEVVARLQGRNVDLAAVAADPRFALLLPHLR